MTDPDILVPYDEYVPPEQIEALVNAAKKARRFAWQLYRESGKDKGDRAREVWLRLKAALAPFKETPLPVEKKNTMRISRQPIPPAHWATKVYCTNCGAILEVKSQELTFRRVAVNCRDKPELYQCKCQACGEVLDVWTDTNVNIPKLVRRYIREVLPQERAQKGKEDERPNLN